MFSGNCNLARTTRRQWFISGGLSFLSACRRGKSAGYPGYALIATSGEKSVAVLDLMRFRLEKSIGLPAEPTAIVSTPSSDRAYVLTPSTGSIHALNRELQVAGSIRLAESLSEIRLTPDGKRLVAISSAKELIDTHAHSLRVNRRYKLGEEGRHLDFGSGDYVAISTGKHGLVELLQLTSGRRWSCRLSGTIGALRFRADGKLLLVANLEERSLVALSVPKLEIIAELPLAMTPNNLCFKVDGGELYVSGEGMDGVAIVFPYQMLEVQQTVLAGRDPGIMACSEDPGYLFVGSASGTDVCVLNIYNRRVIGIVDITQKPTFITITPDSRYALILDEQSGNMAVIHITAIRTTGTAGRYKSGASLFTMVPVGIKPVQAVMVPRMV
ncbi:MAG: hypothetical protein JO150_07185 [Acidobacteriaceae bacterium]|nr:hypothetical protein [Acidobacteriaceae bacterium]